MNAIETIRSWRQRTRRVAASSRLAVVHWDQETIDYLIVSPKSPQISQRDVGRISWAGFDNPLQAVTAQFADNADRPQRWLALLSRPTLEQLSLTLPPADADEVPSLVAAEVEQRLGESDEPPVLDYLPQPSSNASGEATNLQVLAFALAAQEVDRLRDWEKQSGLKLVAIGSRELSPLGILRRKHVAAQSLNISVHMVSGEAELAVCRGAEPIYLRLIRVAANDPQRVAEQVWMETQRCLTILPTELAELPQAWFVFTTCEAAWHLARSLEDRGAVVQPVDPLFGWQWGVDNDSNPANQDVRQRSPQLSSAAEGSTPSESAGPESAGPESAGPESASTGSASTESPGQPEQHHASWNSSAANAGAAWEFLHAALPINLLAPKKAPVPPNPLRRWATIAAACVGLIGLGIYFLLMDVSHLRDEVTELQRGVADAQKLAAKLQEKADQVAYVETWLNDQVDWLAELNELSNRLPVGQQATVRRLTATAAGTEARVDLSVQVAEQQNIAQLESQIRSAKYQATSQRISQNPDSAEYPWQFETHITFAVEPPQRDAYVAGELATAMQDSATPQKPQPVKPTGELPQVTGSEQIPTANHTARQETL